MDVDLQELRENASFAKIWYVKLMKNQFVKDALKKLIRWAKLLCLKLLKFELTMFYFKKIKQLKKNILIFYTIKKIYT